MKNALGCPRPNPSHVSEVTLALGPELHTGWKVPALEIPGHSSIQLGADTSHKTTTTLQATMQHSEHLPTGRQQPLGILGHSFSHQKDNKSTKIH